MRAIYDHHCFECCRNETDDDPKTVNAREGFLMLLSCARPSLGRRFPGLRALPRAPGDLITSTRLPIRELHHTFKWTAPLNH